jgi:NADH-quinone oxidoreductase subunit L
MWVPLVALALLAVVGGFVGVGPAFRFATGVEHPGGKLNIVNWLNPIIWDPQTRDFKTGESAAPESAAEGAGEAHGTTSPYGTGFNLAHAAESGLHSELGAEWLFIVISVVVAGIGIGLGYLFYLKQPTLPDTWAARLRPLYNASYHKYWVDEFYGWAITRRTMDAARAVFSFDSRVVDGIVNGLAALSRLASRIVGGVDKYFVDGLVNSIAAFVARLMSPLFRAAQTGFTQNYALVMVLGLMIGVIAFYGSDIVRAAAETAAAIKSMFGISF